MDQDTADTSQLLNTIFLYVFVVEMFLKLLGEGLLGYFLDPERRMANWLDFVVVVVGFRHLWRRVSHRGKRWRCLWCGWHRLR